VGQASNRPRYTQKKSMGRWSQLVVAFTLVFMPGRVQCLISCANQARPASQQMARACHHHSQGSEGQAPVCPQAILTHTAALSPAPAVPAVTTGTAIRASLPVESLRNFLPGETASAFDSSPPGSGTLVLRI